MCFPVLKKRKYIGYLKFYLRFYGTVDVGVGKDPEASKIFVNILEHVDLTKRKNLLLIMYHMF